MDYSGGGSGLAADFRGQLFEKALIGKRDALDIGVFNTDVRLMLGKKYSMNFFVVRRPSLPRMTII